MRPGRPCVTCATWSSASTSTPRYLLYSLALSLSGLVTVWVPGRLARAPGWPMVPAVDGLFFVVLTDYRGILFFVVFRTL